MREIVNAILYWNRTGVPWEFLPHDFPPYSTVYDHFKPWKEDEPFLRIAQTLHQDVRVDDGNAAPLVLEKIAQDKYIRIEWIWADSKDHNDKLDAWLERHRPGWRIEIMSKPKDAPPGFAVILRRWVVERTFAWMGRNRRLSKDYEHTTTSSVATVWLANIAILMHRLAPKNNTNFNDPT